MKIDKVMLQQISDSLEPYMVMSALMLNNDVSIKMCLETYNVRIYVLEKGWLSWGVWYRFTYKDNKIYMIAAATYGQLSFDTIDEFKDYLMIEYSTGKFLKNYEYDFPIIGG